MRPLTFEEIDSHWNLNSNLTPSEAPRLIEKMKENQPDAFSYLLSSGNDLLEPPEREVVFYTGVIIWYIIDSLHITLPTLKLAAIFEKEETNIRMLEYLSGEPDVDFNDTVDKIMNTYNQSVFLRYIIDRLLEEQRADSGINRNHLGMIVIYLKTFIDCIDAAV